MYIPVKNKDKKRPVNLKIFSNGAIQMTGCKSVENGIEAIPSNNPRFVNSKARSTISTRSKMEWWFTQHIPIDRKLIKYAKYDGQSWASCRPKSWWAEAIIAGTLRLNTKSVIATAKTPSLNASSRLGFIGQVCPTYSRTSTTSTTPTNLAWSKTGRATPSHRSSPVRSST